MAAVRKTAVVLLNLGGPDSKEAIRPFLKNFFMDRNIIRLPFFARWALSEFVSRRRSVNEAGKSYAHLGFCSPLLKNTMVQAQALQEKLGDGHRVFVCMRYWHPMAGEAAREVKSYGADEIILVPMYPQFSTTTTRSAFQAWDKAMKKAGIDVPVRRINCYPEEKGFIAASASLVREMHGAALAETGQRPRILFSAHGLPEKIILGGDPYQWQCERTMAAIISTLGIDDVDAVLCYQSRVGRLRWIGPSTEEEIRRAGSEGVPVVIYPLAFTQEHVETLVELDIEYRHLAQRCGVPGYYRARTVGTHPDFISGLARLCLGKHEGPSACPADFKDCPCRKEKTAAAI